MTPKISLVVIPVLAGLALVPAAWGNHQYGDAAYQAESSVPQSNLRAVLASDSVESAREQVVTSQPFNLREVLASDSVESAREQAVTSQVFNLRDVLASDSVEQAVAASEQSRRTAARAFADSAAADPPAGSLTSSWGVVSRPVTAAARKGGRGFTSRVSAMTRPYRRSLWRRALNAVVRPLARLGLTGQRTHLLTVPGRKTGKLWSTPVSIVEDDGERWLVAPYGERNWVKNARAAGWVELRRGRRSERLAVDEVSGTGAVPVLRRYLELGRATRPFFDAGPESTDEEWLAEAHRHPVFRLQRRNRNL